MEIHEIILLILGCIFGVYLLLIITDLIFVFSFKSILKKHNHALAVILNTKHIYLKKMLEILSKNNISVNENAVDDFNKINISCYDLQSTKECKDARDTLFNLKNEILYVSSDNLLLEKHAEFQVIKENVSELDEVYRLNISMYNADVLGYNYWIRFLPCRYIFLLFKVKRKELL